MTLCRHLVLNVKLIEPFQPQEVTRRSRFQIEFNNLLFLLFIYLLLLFFFFCFDKKEYSFILFYHGFQKEEKRKRMHEK